MRAPTLATGVGPLTVAAPLAVEAMALRVGLGRGVLVRTGYGPDRSRRYVERVALLERASGPAGARRIGAFAVAGLAAGLQPGFAAGDVVVADELRSAAGSGDDGAGPVRCPTAGLLARLLREQGLTVHVGTVLTADRLVTGAAYGELAATGALAVDLESRVLARAAGSRPLAVVRVVVDTPGRPLLHPATAARAIIALRRLAAVGPALRFWAAAVPAQLSEPARVTVPDRVGVPLVSGSPLFHPSPLREVPV